MHALPIKRRFLCGVLMGVAFVVVGTPLNAALHVLGFEPRLHDKYYVGPDKAFIGEGREWSRPGDWTGVGRNKDPHERDGQPVVNYWHVTMISENYFLMAAHTRASRYYDEPGLPPPVRFFRTTDPEGEYWDGTIQVLPGEFDYNGIFLPGADLWLGRFEEAPPDWLRRYPLVKRNLDTNWPTFIDPTVYLIGNDWNWESYTSTRMGRNTINHRLGAMSYDLTSPPGLGADEAIHGGGDSGSPSFVITPAGPTLYNIITTPSGGPTMPAVYDEIQAALAPLGEHVTVVTDLLGDLDADYDVDLSDSAILESHVSTQAAAYVKGDLNRDGAVNQLDRDILAEQMGKTLHAPADFNKDNVIDSVDFSHIAGNWLGAVTPSTNGDATGDGLVNRDDILIFESNRINVFTGDPLIQIAGDANRDGIVNNSDLQLWADNKGRTDVPAPFFADGDVTGDALVDHDDLVLIRDNYGEMFADVDGDTKITISDIDVIIDASRWEQPASNGLADGDVNLDNFVDEIDLAAVGSFLGSLFRAPLPFRNIGIIDGDYDGDFDIDGSDFLVWQRSLGSTTARAADGDANGVVDAEDLTIWQVNFEAVPGGGGQGASGVPEPASLAMLCMAALLCASAYRVLQNAKP